MTPALRDVESADTILKIKAILALFIQTMDVSRLLINKQKLQLIYYKDVGLFHRAIGFILA